MLVPVVVTHSPLSDCDVVSPPVRMLSTIAIGYDQNDPERRGHPVQLLGVVDPQSRRIRRFRGHGNRRWGKRRRWRWRRGGMLDMLGTSSGVTDVSDTSWTHTNPNG